MREDPKLSETTLKIIADESYPAHMDVWKIRNNDAIKEKFKDISDDRILLHVRMLEEEGLIEAKILHKKTLDGATCLVDIIGLTKQGSNRVRYIESSLWGQAKKNWENAKKPLIVQLIYSFCKKLINKK